MTTSAPDPRRVEYVPLAEIAPDPRNPKAHAEEVIDQSIGRFGMLDLIVRDERTGQIVSGHGRRKALTAMHARGESAPEGVRVAEDGTWLVPVVSGWASRSDTEAAAALVALNRTTELGGWVDDSLLEILDELGQMDDGFEGVGYTDEEMEALRQAVSESDDPSDRPPAPGSAGFLDPGDDSYREQYGVTVICTSEAHQQEVYERLLAEGFDLRVVTV